MNLYSNRSMLDEGFHDINGNHKFEDLYEVYFLYFDEVRGHFPLLTYPDEFIKDDDEKMRMVTIHSIWFIDIKDQPMFDRINLEVGGKAYFAQKILIPTTRIKKRAGIEEEFIETYVLIVSIPVDLDLFGSPLLDGLTFDVIMHFKEDLYKLVESETLKTNIIKSPGVIEKIKIGDKVRDQLKIIIKQSCESYFSSAVSLSDAAAIKIQKAIAYLSLKGINVSQIMDGGDKSALSNIRLFEQSGTPKKALEITRPFIVSSVEHRNAQQELEILVKNISNQNIQHIIVKITYIKEFFEREIFEESIEIWNPQEEILFIAPVIPRINEYLFFVIKEENDKKLFSKRIDISQL